MKTTSLKTPGGDWVAMGWPRLPALGLPGWHSHKKLKSFNPSDRNSNKPFPFDGVAPVARLGATGVASPQEVELIQPIRSELQQTIAIRWVAPVARFGATGVASPQEVELIQPIGSELRQTVAIHTSGRNSIPSLSPWKPVPP